MATKINVASLIDAGVHFGHQTRRWNPKMKPYIFTSRKGIHIIDLKQTLIELDTAYSFFKELAEKNGTVLFVGTKKQAQEPIQFAAERCGMPYVNNRWLGGMLTNFVTIRSRVTYMEELEAMDEDGRMASLPKKEQVLLRKKLAKLQANLNGVRNMTATPQAVFVVDTKREEIAVAEARRLNIPVIGILDTNADPDEVVYGIPGNDDAIRSVSLITNCVASAIVAGAADEVLSEAEMILDESAAVPAAVALDFGAPKPAEPEPITFMAGSEAPAPDDAASLTDIKPAPTDAKASLVDDEALATDNEAPQAELVAAATIEETPAEIVEEVAEATDEVKE
jgi:small subunit ribosomal protein S2